MFVRSETNNGGVDFLGTFGFALNNSGGDTVGLRCDGQLIDQVAYQVSGGFPSTNNQSLSLDPDLIDAAANDNGGSWCAATTVYFESSPDDTDSQNFGTPTAQNPDCP